MKRLIVLLFLIPAFAFGQTWPVKNINVDGSNVVKKDVDGNVEIGGTLQVHEVLNEISDSVMFLLPDGMFGYSLLSGISLTELDSAGFTITESQISDFERYWNYDAGSRSLYNTTDGDAITLNITSLNRDPNTEIAEKISFDPKFGQIQILPDTGYSGHYAMQDYTYRGLGQDGATFGRANTGGAAGTYIYLKRANQVVATVDTLGNASFNSADLDEYLTLTPTTTPTATTGRIYTNSADNKPYFYDGTTWYDLTATGTSTDNQTLSTDDTPGDISIENGNSITINVQDNDADATNELQDLTLTGDNLSLTNSAVNIDLSPYDDPGIETETDPVFSAHTTSNITDGTGFLKNNGTGTWSYDNTDYDDYNAWNLTSDGTGNQIISGYTVNLLGGDNVSISKTTAATSQDIMINADQMDWNWNGYTIDSATNLSTYAGLGLTANTLSETANTVSTTYSLGTPSTITGSTSNGATASSHTHALSFDIDDADDTNIECPTCPTLASGQILEFDGQDWVNVERAEELPLHTRTSSVNIGYSESKKVIDEVISNNVYDGVMLNSYLSGRAQISTNGGSIKYSVYINDGTSNLITEITYYYPPEISMYYVNYIHDAKFTVYSSSGTGTVVAMSRAESSNPDNHATVLTEHSEDSIDWSGSVSIEIHIESDNASINLYQGLLETL